MPSAGGDGERQPERSAAADHGATSAAWPRGQAGAAVRSAARRRAERARGLPRASSARRRGAVRGQQAERRLPVRAMRPGDGDDGGIAAGCGRCAGAGSASRAGPRANGRSRRRARPPDRSSASAATRPRSELAQLVVHVRCAGLEGAGRRIDAARRALPPRRGARSRPAAAVRVIGASLAGGDDGAGDDAGPPLLAIVVDDVGEFALARSSFDEIGGARAAAAPCACRAGRRGGRRSRARRWSICIEDTPMSRATPSAPVDAARRSAARAMSPKRPADQLEAARHNAAPAGAGGDARRGRGRCPRRCSRRPPAARGCSRRRRRCRRRRCRRRCSANAASTSRSSTGRWPPAAPAVRSTVVMTVRPGAGAACGPFSSARWRASTL